MDGFGDIELVHGRQDDGGCGQEKQHHEESEVDAQPLEPPAEALNREVLPTEERGLCPRTWRLMPPGPGHQQCPQLEWVRISH